MATKLQFYSAVSEQTVNDIIAKRGNWMNFLDTAARLYKYSFPDQLMIHAQRPNASACAPIETWNDSFSRWVRRGSKGIALIDDSGSYPRLKYVFDVADTEPTIQNSRPVNLWEMRQEHKAPVLEALAKTYDDVDDTLADSFHNIAKQLASEYYGDNAREIRYRAEGSYLEDFDDYNLGVAFENALSTSIAYTLMSRCGFDTADHFDDDDFKHIIEFNTPEMVYALGTATSELSEQVLRDIEIVIKKYERQHAAERSVTNERNHNVQQSRGLSSAQPDTRGASDGVDGTARTVLADAQSVSERTSDNDVQRHAAVGEAVSASEGSGGSGERETDTGDERNDRAEHTARQGNRFDGLDGGDERAESGSGGNGAERADLRVLEEQSQAEISADGAVNETAPFSMAELAQLHTDWNEHIINGVLQDKAVINAAVKGDKEHALTEIDTAIKRMRVELNQKIMGSASTKGKIEHLTELDLYLFKDRKPPLREQLYDAVIRSDIYKEELSKNEIPPVQEAIPAGGVSESENGASPEQEKPVSDGGSAVEETYSQVGNRLPEILSGSAVTLDEVDAILRDGGNYDSHKLVYIPFHSRSGLRIAARFSKDIPMNELSDFLRCEYLQGLHSGYEKPSGKGFDFGNHHVCAWYSENGIQLAIGVTAKNNIHAVTIPWEQAALRIKELMLAGQYISVDAFDSAIDCDRHELASALWNFYRDDLHEIPEEWHGEKYGHPDDIARIKSLLDDDSEREDILDRLEIDVEEWENDSESRSWHDPYRLLADMRTAMLPPVIFPTSDVIETKDFSYFITQDEIDALLTHGGNYSEGKYRMLSFFLGDHDSKEKVDFMKHEYGHGGGTWSETNGWRDAEPGKGVTLQRGGISNPDAEVNLKWNAVISRTEQLILEGRYMTRAELDYIPHYERLALVRSVNSFFCELPEEYERPFPGKSDLFYDEYRNEDGERTLNFTYPREAEWQAIRDFLDNPERVDKMLAQMERVYVNTPEEDRYYDLRKTGFERLSAYREGTFTLFPNLDTLPDPEAPTRIVMRSKPYIPPPPASVEQMSLFGDIADTPLPILPSVDEQQVKIEQSHEPTAEVTASAVSLPITQDEIDALLMSVSDADKERIAARFADNPRSREAVQLVREIYGSIEETMPRIDGADGYLGILGETSGVAIAKGTPASTPERPPADTLALSMTAVHKRVAELVADGRFAVMEKPQIIEVVNNSAPELDFDTVAETALTRVMQDVDYLKDMAEAKSREALRNPCFWALEQSIRDHEKDEPEVFQMYFSDQDFRDSLGYYILRQSWASRTAPKTVVGQQEVNDASKETPPITAIEHKPTSRDLGGGFIAMQTQHNAYTKDETDAAVAKLDPVLRGALADENFFDSTTKSNIANLLSHGVLKHTAPDYVRQITDYNRANNTILLSDGRKAAYCADNRGVFVTTERSLIDGFRSQQANSFTTLPSARLFKWEQAFNAIFTLCEHQLDGFTLSDETQLSFDAEQEKASEREADAHSAENETSSIDVPTPDATEQVQDTAEIIEEQPTNQVSAETPLNTTSTSHESPPPVFFVDWESAQFDFDLKAYNDGDIIGYDKDGVKRALGRSGNLSYVTSTGLLWGGNEVPGNIYEQIEAYKNGDVNDEQVRENYLAALKAFTEGSKKQYEHEPVAEPILPVAEKLLEDFSLSGKEKTAYYLLHHPHEADSSASLSHDSLALIKDSADQYVICADMCYLSEDEMAEWNIDFCKMPRDWSYLPDAVQAQIRTIKPDYETEWKKLRGVPEAVSEQVQPFMVLDNTARSNYNLFMLAFPQIVNGSYSSMSFQNEENGHKLEIWHDFAKAGKIEFHISYDSPSGIKVYEPMATFQMNFERHMLKLDNYENTITGVNIGYLHSRSPDDEKRLNELEVNIYELLAGIKEQGFEPVSALVFKDAEGKPLPAEPKRHFTEFLKEQSDRFVNDYASDEHANPEDMQQTLLNAAPMPDDSQKQTESMREKEISSYEHFLRAKDRYHNHVIFTTVGDFNELHEDDALYAADNFGCSLTFRNISWQDVPIVGIPKNTVDAMISRFNEIGRDVVYVNSHGAMAEHTQEEFKFVREKLQTYATPDLPKPQSGVNFRITDDHLGEGGAKTKFHYNIDAITTLRAIEQEKRAATPEEQQTLARYVGWGGLPQAFDAENTQWANEYRELNALLSSSEFESARASTLNAHYTSPTVIKAIYEAVENMGFKRGNVLEPALGVGNFFGLLPDSMKDSNLYGVELDSLTAQIAKKLYPKANIKATGFEKTDMPDAFFDLAIGNVPFGSYSIVDKRYDKHKFFIHDYFFGATRS